jgi:hypothetical protein
MLRCGCRTPAGLAAGEQGSFETDPRGLLAMTRPPTVLLVIASAGLLAVAMSGLGGCTPHHVPGDPAPAASASPTPAPAAEPAAPPGPPQLVLPHAEFDFGTMETDSRGRHEFTLTNEGGQPLILSRSRNSCGCCTCLCEAQLPEQGSIPPHQSATVTLQWKIKQYTGNYQQSETLTTNDPQQPEVTLRVTGRVTPTVRVVPTQLVFSRVPSGQPAVGEILLYGYRPQPLQIVSREFSDPATAAAFQLTLQPLTPDQLAAEADARSGYLLRIEVQPRLAGGPFQQQIVLHTNVDSAPTVEIPVQGTVGSELAITGFGWDEQMGVLTLGTIAIGKGTERKLHVVARGPNAGKVKLTPVRVVPDVLQVAVGPSRPLGDGSVVQHPWTVRIPPESRAANHLGSKASDLGQIVLATGHPQQPELRVFVRFAVRPEVAR